MSRPRRYRDVRVSRPRRDRDVGATVSRRDRDVQKNSSRPSRDRDVRDRDYNPVIETAASPCSSNVMMVKKKDGTMHFCVDYRKVNQLIKKDKFPLPKIDTCLDTLNGRCFYSSCDLRQGYWQTELQEEDRDKTAFLTRKGQWRFKILSFGLCNAPSQFT